ncbi:uncharacterized protein LOC122864151 [Xyrichtys novacula]|uniref:Uncharacterized protein LOC122864151 n=1 Tax=Xyrichtys novacula TaxID=13765 RepID=A0AAV1HE10_XYRNO|nr:uncharacterized protein LOC122864151 [Xyrichtys novacula]
MGKSQDLTEFERGMIVGARRSGCSVSVTVKRLGFAKTTVSRVYREWLGKQKTSSQRGSSGRKRLVDDIGERKLEQVVEENPHATIAQIQALYNKTGPKKPISHKTTQRALKKLGYSCRSQQGEDVTLALAGLEALAAFNSKQPETSEEPVCNKNEPSPKVKASLDSSDGVKG